MDPLDFALTHTNHRGCVACINSIDSALKSKPGVVQAAASLKPVGLKGGEATVRLAATDESQLKQQLDTLCQAVQAAGFDGCTIESVK
jgi:copper chaperone CopZ